MEQNNKYNPLFLGRYPIVGEPTKRKLAAVLIGIFLLSLSSWISVPVLGMPADEAHAVPMTMQTFAVSVIGVFFGWRLGVITVVLWLAAAAAGLPLLAQFKSGLAPFFGPTAGYLLAFPAVTGFVGVLAENGLARGGPIGTFLIMLAANILCVGIGGFVLALSIGPAKAFALGVTPFVLGSLFKAALATGLIMIGNGDR